VYPNYTTTSPFWCLGNLKEQGAETILRNYVNNKSIAQNIKLTVPVSKMVAEQGNPESMRLFLKQDYKTIYSINIAGHGIPKNTYSLCFSLCNSIIRRGYVFTRSRVKPLQLHVFPLQYSKPNMYSNSMGGINESVSVTAVPC